MVGRVVASAAALVAASGCGAGAAESPAPVSAARASIPQTVRGIVWERQQGRVHRLDALTLRPIGSSRAVIRAGIHSFSPDARTIAFGTAEGRSELVFVDARTLRRVGKTVALGAPGWVGHIVWASPTRLLVFVGAGADRAHLVLVDVAKRTVVRIETLRGSAVASDAGAGRLVVLLAPAEAIGTATLAVADAADGRVRTVPLAEVRAGSEPIEHAEDAYARRQLQPGLALSPDGKRALVVPPGNRVAEVDLETREVSYRALREPSSLLRQLREWAEPRAEAKVVVGPLRVARWLGDDLVAVSGMDYHGIVNGKWVAEPAGLRLIDTRDWTIRKVDDSVTAFTRVPGLLLAYGGSWPEDAEPHGLIALGPDGETRFRALAETRVGWVESAWPLAYVAENVGAHQRFVVLDLRSGEVLARPQPRQYVSVLGP